jgi:hypothetical protein
MLLILLILALLIVGGGLAINYGMPAEWVYAVGHADDEDGCGTRMIYADPVSATVVSVRAHCLAESEKPVCRVHSSASHALSMVAVP